MSAWGFAAAAGRRQDGFTIRRPMLLLNPFCPISSAKIAGLKATVFLLLVLLFKSKLLRIKMSLLGSFLGLLMLTGFLLSTGLLSVVTGGAVIYAANQKRR